MQTAAFDAEVHHAFIDQLRRTGCAPSRHEVSAALARPVNEIEEALRRLSASHGVVLHPHAGSRTWPGMVRASLRSKLAQMVRCRGNSDLRKSRPSRTVLEFGKPRRQFLSHAGRRDSPWW